MLVRLLLANQVAPGLDESTVIVVLGPEVIATLVALVAVWVNRRGRGK